MPASLAQVAPLMLPLDPACTSAEGYVSIAGGGAEQPSSLWVHVSGIPQDAATLRGARLEVGAELAELLSGHEEVLTTRLNESASLAAFFLELRTILGHLAAHRRPSLGRPASFFSTLRAELNEAGWGRVDHLAEDLSAVTLQVQDHGGRTHSLLLTLPPAYPAAPPVATADLPAAFNPQWGRSSRLADVVQQFEHALQRHQALWDDLDDLDEHAWVVEPAQTRRSVAYRRIALGNHVTLALTMDPLQAGAHPECRFMGSDRSVEPLMQRLHANRALWRQGARLRDNLEAVLDMQLPCKQAAGGGEAEDVSVDCAICYAYRLPSAAAEAQAAGGGAAASGMNEGDVEGAGEVPDVNCDNAACGKPFHRHCLSEWLAADTTTRQSFGTLFGACPYCSAPIMAKATS